MPATARLIGPFAGIEMHLEKLDLTEKPITVHLPTGWKTFYWMSLCFAAAQMIYFLRCPKVIRLYPTFGDYRRDHSGAVTLNRLLRDLFWEYDTEAVKLLDERMRSYVKDGDQWSQSISADQQPTPERNDRDQVVDLLFVWARNDKTLSDVHATLVECGQRVRLNSFCASATLFTCGAILFLITVFQNLLAVLQIQ